MRNRLLFLLLMLFMVITNYGQEISRREADSMLKALQISKPDIERINLLLNIAQFHIFKPGEQQIDFDSAMIYINQAFALNKTLKSSAGHGYQLLTESYLLKEKGQKDKGKKMVEEAVSVLELGNNKFYLGKAYYELSSYYNYDDPQQLSEKISMVERAVNIFQESGNIERKASSLTMLADLYDIRDNDGQKAMEAIQAALAAYQSIGYKQLQGVYALLGSICMTQNKYGLALQYALLALKTAQSLNDTSIQLCQLNNMLGVIFKNMGQNEMALKYFKDALETAKKYEDYSSVFRLIWNITNTLITSYQSQEAINFLDSIPKKFSKPSNDIERYFIAISFCKSFTNLKQFQKARPYLDILLKLSESIVLLDLHKNNINRTIAEYYLATGEFSGARIYLIRNRDSIQFIGGLPFAYTCMLWYKLDSAQGNYQSAFNHLLAYKAVSDSLFNVTQSRQLQQAQVQFETAKKEDSLKLRNQDNILLTQKNRLQSADLKQASLIQNVTIGGIILALIIIGLLYRQYRQKQKSNIVITQKNEQLQHYLTEKEWLLKEIHHRVKNNLQIVMSLLNSQSAYIDNEPALTAIHDSQHRVHAMSLIHQKLYNTENVSTIDMSAYIRELVSYLSDSFNSGQRISFEYNIEPLELDVSQAVPLGLILNEAITNSIKYAFPDNRNGIINISLLNTTPNHFILSISDNGVGMPVHFSNKKPGSLGMSLMAGLSEDLDGNFSIENNSGTKIIISFVHEEIVHRHNTLTASFI